MKNKIKIKIEEYKQPLRTIHKVSKQIHTNFFKHNKTGKYSKISKKSLKKCEKLKIKGRQKNALLVVFQY